MNLLTDLLFYISGWVLIFLILSWLLAGLYPLFSRMLKSCPPVDSAFFVFLYSFIPFSVAWIAMLMQSVPELAFSLVSHHCHGNDCAPHHVQVTLSNIQSITIVSVLLLILLAVFVVIARQLFMSRQRLHTLDMLSDSGTASYKVLDNDVALAWCAGLLKPQIYVSRALVDTLSAEQLSVVLTHEIAHLKRKDNLRKWLLHWLTVAWPSHWKNQIRRELSEVTEQVCDYLAMHYHHKTLGREALAEVIQQCYLSVDKCHQSGWRAELKSRLEALQKVGLHAIDNDIHPFLPMAFIGGLWLICVMITVHLSHPLLEWL